MSKDKQIPNKAPETEVGSDLTPPIAKRPEETGSAIRIVPSSIGTLAQAAKAIEALKLKSSVFDTIARANKAFESLKLGTSNFDAITQVSKTIDSLKLNTSAFDAIAQANKTLNSLKLNTPTFDAQMLTMGRPSDLSGFADAVARALAMSSAKSAAHRNPSKLPAIDRATESTIIASPSDIGKLIRMARKAKGLSQQQFADLAGVGRRFVSECEKGKPRLEFGKVLQVAAAAGIDILAKKR